MVSACNWMGMAEPSGMLKKIRMFNKYFISALGEKASSNLVGK